MSPARARGGQRGPAAHPARRPIPAGTGLPRRAAHFEPALSGGPRTGLREVACPGRVGGHVGRVPRFGVRSSEIPPIHRRPLTPPPRSQSRRHPHWACRPDATARSTTARAASATAMSWLLWLPLTPSPPPSPTSGVADRRGGRATSAGPSECTVLQPARTAPTPRPRSHLGAGGCLWACHRRSPSTCCWLRAWPGLPPVGELSCLLGLSAA